ncbi:M23 family metallopeptidase [Ornithinibacillus xuwenensis]|uniref:M23 family metallopeptidase n=1 Tax=Ornithinibacillus xuwenensis TaxID=3144668 RepID=A0ABU9XEX1_9BACI
MKRKKKRNSSVVTFTILSDDVNKVVTRFRMRKPLVYVLFTIPIIPVVALIYYVYVNLNQQAEIEALSGNLATETTKSEQLEQTVSMLEAETGDTKEKLEELTELEQQMRNYINELPTMVDPSGGLHISVDEQDMVESADGTSFLPSSELLVQYKDTLAVMDEVSDELRYTPTAWPTIPNSFSSDYGVRSDPLNSSEAFHTGVDIRGYYGTPVYATADGTVTMAEYYGSYGNAIRIRHSGTYQTLYGHLSSIDVEVGDVVKKGDTIGTIGSTGRSTGPHLHYEVVKNGEPIDPKPYFNIYGEYDVE